jgi:hypothetical protein
VAFLDFLLIIFPITTHKPISKELAHVCEMQRKYKKENLMGLIFM